MTEQSPQPLKTIAILGGGTAGWMAAALFSRVLSKMGVEITLVEAEDIPTIGVGEATVPLIRLFNGLLGIDEREFVRQTEGSFKLGIAFDDWGALGSRYFHAFGDFGDDIEGIAPHHHWLKLKAQGHSEPLSDYSFPTVAAYAGKFAPPPENPTSDIPYYSYAYHFDASLYARYLKSYSIERGVKHQIGRVEDVRLCAETGHVETLNLQDGQRIKADLFIDCTGFRGELIDKVMGSSFMDWRHWLPVDRAVAIPSARTKPLVPYTISAAMPAGWRWRIPLQQRVGSGYVYSSGFIDQDTAEVEMMATLEAEAMAPPRHIQFAAGCRQEFWVKNVISIGLSAGFLEPLESTSIQIIQNGLTRIIEYFPDMSFDPVLISEYNRVTRNEYERIRDFIILHYALSTRQDGELWRYVQSMSLPDSLRHKIDVYTHSGRVPMLTEESYSEASWVSIFVGNGVLPKRYDPVVDRVDNGRLTAGMGHRRQAISQLVSRMPAHTDFISQYCSVRSG